MSLVCDGAPGASYAPPEGIPPQLLAAALQRFISAINAAEIAARPESEDAPAAEKEQHPRSSESSALRKSHEKTLKKKKTDQKNTLQQQILNIYI